MAWSFLIGFLCSLVSQPTEGVSQRAAAYRALAGQTANAMLLAADSATLSDAAHREIKTMLQAYLTELAEQSEAPEIQTMSREEIATAATETFLLFESETLSPWQSAHVAQTDAIRRELRVAEILLLKAPDTEALVAAAQKAGLPAEKEPDFRAEIAAAQKAFESVVMMRRFFNDTAANYSDADLASTAMDAELAVEMAKAQFRSLKNLRAILQVESREEFDKALLATESN